MELEMLEATGHGGGFAPNAPKSEMKSYQTNFEKMKLLEGQIKEAKVRPSCLRTSLLRIL